MSVVYLFQRICVTVKLDMTQSYLLYGGFVQVANKLIFKISGYKEQKGTL